MMLFACHGIAFASEPSPKTLSCAGAEDARYCEHLKSDFLASWPKANSGDYMSQRNVAFCLLSGCQGAVEVNFLKACTWAIVIAGADEADSTDRRNFVQSCRRVSPAEMTTAETDARQSFARIYKRLMTKPLPYLPPA
jgi:hypothetical protein